MNRPNFLFRPNMQNEDHRRAWRLLQEAPEGQKSAFIVRAILQMDQEDRLETMLRRVLIVMRGNGGGVTLPEGYYVSQRHLTPKQADAIRRNLSIVHTEDRETFESILSDFAWKTEP